MHVASSKNAMDVVKVESHSLEKQTTYGLGTYRQWCVHWC